MRDTFLPFSAPSISEQEIANVADVLRSGWITTGKKAAELEDEFKNFIGCPGAVALTSATAGMHVLFRALDIGPGDEVITPSMTWVSTVNLVVLAGATPVFVDVDRDTLMVTPEAIALKITDRTKAIVPVHFAGASADLAGIYEIAKARGIQVIEDSAHAVGTHFNGTHVGARGTSVFSFHPIKNMTTGEGGMVTSDNPELLDRVRRLKFHGLGVDAFDRQTQGRSPQAEVIEPGYKYNLPDILAVIGLGQLARIPEFNSRRLELANHYRKKLEGVSEVLPLSIPAYAQTHAWHLFIVRVLPEKAGLNRDEFMAELKRQNIGTGIHFRAAHLQRYYTESMGMKRGMLPNTEWNSDRICSLPLFPAMTERDVDDVVEAIKQTVSKK